MVGDDLLRISLVDTARISDAVNDQLLGGRDHVHGRLGKEAGKSQVERGRSGGRG